MDFRTGKILHMLSLQVLHKFECWFVMCFPEDSPASLIEDMTCLAEEPR
jgi:hypothetical protein